MKQVCITQKLNRTTTYNNSTMKNDLYKLITTHMKIFLDKENPCTPNYCFNGGLCKPDENGNAMCICQPGYEGDHCETSKGLETYYYLYNRQLKQT